MTKLDEIIDAGFAADDFVTFEPEQLKRTIRKYAEYYAKLCLNVAAENAEVGFLKYEEDDEGEFEVWVKAKRLYSDDYKYSNNFDSLPSMQVYKESITNIQLPEHD